MNLVRNTIETRERENIVRPDMLHLLMQAKKEVEQKNASDDLSDVVNKNNQLGKFNTPQSTETNRQASIAKALHAGCSTMKKAKHDRTRLTSLNLQSTEAPRLSSPRL